MKSQLLLTAFLSAQLAWGQPKSGYSTPPPARNWPLMVSLQAHNVAMPFGDIGSAFTNVGFSLGTEYACNRRGNLLQSGQIGYFRNRYAGDGLFALTQVGYRPHIGPVFGELKVGIGWLYAFNPQSTQVWRNGEWQKQERSGQSMAMVPIGVSLGYENRAHPSRIVPFVGVQFMLIVGYNRGIPILPNQLIQVGSRIYF